MIHTNTVQTETYEIRYETHDGREYLVVPVVMMKTGVHHGSAGRVFHDINELGAIPDTWNGIPVTIGHPKDGERFVSANSPAQHERAVGKIFNTHVDGDKLKAEAWIDVQKITAINPTALEYITEKKALDVSVGIYTDDIATAGKYDSEQYDAIARNYRPDHLALLPGERGACSWQEGCGIRNNEKHIQEKGGDMNIEIDVQKVGVHSLQLNESYNETIELIHRELQKNRTETNYYYLVDVYDDSFIYESIREPNLPEMYKQTYNVQDGVIELTGEPERVRREVNYLALNAAENTPQNQMSINFNKEEQMTDEKTPCCMEKIEALIANEHTRFVPRDKEFLMTVPEPMLDKFEPVVSDYIADYKATLTTADDFLALMPDDMKAQMQEGIRLYTEKRTQTIQSITANTGDTWTEDELKAMSDEHLEKLAKSVKAPADYSALKTNKAVSKEDILLPLGVELK